MSLTKKYELQTIAYHPEFTDITGSVNAAIIIQQLLYWWDRKRGRYIYKTVAEMTRETSLSKHQQAAACKALVGLGFIKIHYKGTYKIRHFEVMIEAVDEALGAYVKQRGPLKRSTKTSATKRLSAIPKPQSSEPKSGEPVVRKPDHISTEKRPTITEITTENTSDTLSASVTPPKNTNPQQGERETKSSYPKKPLKHDLPSWLDTSLWETWRQTRQAKFGPMPPAAEALALTELSNLVKQGWPAAEILREAIARCTPRFYPPCKPGTEQQTLLRLKQSTRPEAKQNSKHNSKNLNTQAEHELRQEVQWLSQMIAKDGNQKNKEAFEQQLTRARIQLQDLQRQAA